MRGGPRETARRGASGHEFAIVVSAMAGARLVRSLHNGERATAPETGPASGSVMRASERASTGSKIHAAPMRDKGVRPYGSV